MFWSQVRRRVIAVAMLAAGLAGFVVWDQAARGGAGADGPASPVRTDPVGAPVPLAGAEQFDLRARSGRTYRIFVAGPVGGVPPVGSPVVYLSDGNSNFPILVAAAQRQSRDAPQAVVVGIGYPTDDAATHREQRTIDLAPPGPSRLRPDDAGTAGTGGVDSFLDFIETELKPVIERRHKIDRSRQALFGHSFGALFVLHVLFHRPEAFQIYVASSPSIWWNEDWVRAGERRFLDRYQDKPLNARLLVSAGQREETLGPEVNPDAAAVLAERRMVTRARDLTARLARLARPGFTVEFREFADEGHGTVVLPSSSWGMRRAFGER